MLLTLLSPTRTLQSLTGVLTMTGAIAQRPKYPIVVAGTLTTAGTISPRLRVTQALTGVLTSSATLLTQYIPPPDLLLRLLRRNQTD